MAKRKQDWSPSGSPWFEDRIDPLLRQLKKSGHAEAVTLAEFLEGLRAEGDLNQEMVLAVLDEFEGWTKYIRMLVEELR
jgi:hypothetical protein